MTTNKYNIYQVFTRLFGNKKSVNTPWGSAEQNGLGKFSDFTDQALAEIQKLGITHIWYTGVPHHALVRDYTRYGIRNDHPSVVKGRAGSPYAVKDYYSVNPDLADNPELRNEEFAALIHRTHNAGMKVIIDIVPNHVARQYHGLNNPAGVNDFGANDDTSVEYAKNNNFYYIPQQPFELPDIPTSLLPLGGEKHPDLATPYHEYPAKWTGNGSRLAKPNADDWYETVKVNYGIKPDGSKDFVTLPEEYRFKSHREHALFWQDKNVPDSWVKFRDIALYWINKGVDGFRYDMAEMVPIEFWSYMNSAIKQQNPHAFLLAEVYQPKLYRDYIQLGKMDYLYDKVDLYDSLKAIMQGHGSTKEIGRIEYQLRDIEHHMLHFLDNHDEQRIASPQFAGSAEKALPAMLISTCLSTAPTMIYFGQEVGEAGAEHAGFGQPSRTSIFDYIGVPSHQRWINNGLFDGGQLTDSEKQLRDFYCTLLNLAKQSPALMGECHDLYAQNVDNFAPLQDSLFAFARGNTTQKLIIAANFSDAHFKSLHLSIPMALIKHWGLSEGEYPLFDHLTQQALVLVVNEKEDTAYVPLQFSPLSTHFIELI
ncbi:alpha-amylase family glycosyl hydrolase [Vibrio aestuarianus]|uniref:alpha-amylase family glycosyl hydrolase n=1 Tax=Vibrio aestuarianus TaxID=28171 RepID=UPI00237C9E46|nr:alpha-amylase family glycosyl hydrolase [Vibrio aestuarianus]MDE1336811.1 alpha-amylase family protein [Vibrio aestuarianus]